MLHAIMPPTHPRRTGEQAALIKTRFALAIMEMPEMHYKICLVARELMSSYAAYSIGVRIGSPCLVRLLHDALLLEGSGDAVHTPRRKF